MLTKAQTLAIATRLETLRRKIIDIADGLAEHHATTGSRDAQRMLRCAAADVDSAGAFLRLEVTRKAAS